MEWKHMKLPQAYGNELVVFLPSCCSYMGGGVFVVFRGDFRRKMLGFGVCFCFRAGRQSANVGRKRTTRHSRAFGGMLLQLITSSTLPN
jgi:hypothetical protein